MFCSSLITLITVKKRCLLPSESKQRFSFSGLYIFDFRIVSSAYEITCSWALLSSNGLSCVP